MEKRTQGSESRGQFGDEPDPRQPAQAAPPMFAAAPPVTAAPATQPPLAGDGQLVELGYGHGV